jgi:hypothetical protein
MPLPLPTRAAANAADIDPAEIAANDLTIDTFQAAMTERFRLIDSFWVVHIPIAAPDMAGAMAVAVQISRRVASRFPAADVGMTEVSVANRQGVRHRVFCNGPLDHGGPCRRRPGHTTKHADYDE